MQERDHLLSEVWGYESAIDTRTVDTLVRRLRKKLGPAANAIITARGFGYRLREGRGRLPPHQLILDSSATVRPARNGGSSLRCLSQTKRNA